MPGGSGAGRKRGDVRRHGLARKVWRMMRRRGSLDDGWIHILIFYELRKHCIVGRSHIAKGRSFLDKGRIPNRMDGRDSFHSRRIRRTKMMRRRIGRFFCAARMNALNAINMFDVVNGVGAFDARICLGMRWGRSDTSRQITSALCNIFPFPLMSDMCINDHDM